jgi:hypothetical protein
MFAFPTGAPTSHMNDPDLTPLSASPLADGGGAGPLQTGPSVRQPTRAKTWTERLEAWASRLSIKNNFFHWLFSLVWLPFAARSGIKMYSKHAMTRERFAAILPFRRFNRNFYDAMAGAALLGNSEVAAGMYLFSVCGGDYTVVCKEMKYRFLRPCLGPAIYRVVKSEDVEEKVKRGGEFNVTLELEVYQQQIVKKVGETLVGRCDITFHCTPKDMVRDRADRRKARAKRRAAAPNTPSSPKGTEPTSDDAGGPSA